jgi:hypothetical protein
LKSTTRLTGTKIFMRAALRPLRSGLVVAARSIRSDSKRDLRLTSPKALLRRCETAT